MSKAKFITLLFNLLSLKVVKSKKPATATVQIEITPALFHRCTLYNVSPEQVIHDFVAQLSDQGSPAGSLADESVFEYLSRAYGNLRSVNTLAVQQKRAVAL